MSRQELLLGLPAAIVATLTLLSYAVGILRPVQIKDARYWTTGTGGQRVTELSCTVKNRRVNVDRTLTGLALIRVPSLGHRLLHRRWRRKLLDNQAYLLFGADQVEIQKGKVQITKRDERTLRCKLRGPDGQPLRPDERLADDVRLLAFFGSSRPARKRPAYEGLPGDRS